MPGALELLNNPAQSCISVAQWAEYRWSMEWQKRLLDSIHLLGMLAQRHRELAFPDVHGSGLTAFEPALIYSARKRTYGVWVLRRPVSVAQLTR